MICRRCFSDFANTTTTSVDVATHEFPSLNVVRAVNVCGPEIGSRLRCETRVETCVWSSRLKLGCNTLPMLCCRIVVRRKTSVGRSRNRFDRVVTALDYNTDSGTVHRAAYRCNSCRCWRRGRCIVSVSRSGNDDTDSPITSAHKQFSSFHRK
jgi:hypothetical protein